MSVLSEISNIFNSLSTFLKDTRGYISTGSSFPDISDIESLTYSESLTYVTSNALGSAGFEIGAVQESIMTADAVSRECAMAALSKSELYTDILADLDREIQYYDSSEAYFRGVSSGHNTNGSRS